MFGEEDHGLWFSVNYKFHRFLSILNIRTEIKLKIFIGFGEFHMLWTCLYTIHRYNNGMQSKGAGLSAFHCTLFSSQILST